MKLVNILLLMKDYGIRGNKVKGTGFEIRNRKPEKEDRNCRYALQTGCEVAEDSRNRGSSFGFGGEVRVTGSEHPAKIARSILC